METRHDLEHTTERLTEGLRCPWKDSGIFAKLDCRVIIGCLKSDIKIKSLELQVC